MGNLTNSQKSIWVTEQYYKGSSINNICGTAIIDEQVDFEKLKESIQIVCQKHDNFWLKLKRENEKIKQLLSERKEIQIDIINVEDSKELEKERNKIVRIPFKLENSELFKFYIFKFKNGEGAFMLNIHHLISDAWTLAFICNEIIKTYSALKQNKEIETKAIYSYIDYIKSEQDYIKSEKYQKDKAYWEEKFKILPEVASIPGSIKDKIDTNNPSGERKQYELESNYVSKIKEYCKANKISLYNFFMAIYAIYIGEISNLSEFVIGTPILNRTNFKEKNAAGMFINMIPFKINLDEALDFKLFAKNIALDSISMLKHQKYSYQALLENLREKNKNIPNLYNILLSYQITNAKQTEENINYRTEWTFNGCCADNMDIHIYDINDTGNLNIAYDYKTSIYTSKDIEEVHDRILNIIFQVISNENIKLNDIDIVTPEEKEKLLVEFNNTAMDYDESNTVINSFERQVIKKSDKIAIVSNGIKLTYSELNERANQLANKLKEAGVQQDNIVSVMVNRSPEMIIAIIAILKCGATYLPIDPEYPIDRIIYMIEDSETKIVLVNDRTKENELNNSVTINIGLENNEIYQNYDKNVELKSNSSSLAYVIYTSGSTGKPKGVRVTNRNLNNFVNGMKQLIDFNSNKTMISVTTICFDIFGLEMWCSLTSGMTLVIANEEEQNMPTLLNKLCIENKVNMIQTTPSRYSTIFEDKCNLEFTKNLTEILVGGEAIGNKLLEKMQKVTQAHIFNMYGPTETTIWSTVKDLTKETIITIGKPIANTQCYILNKNHKLLPTNVPGELYIGGTGVSNGYLKRDELNAEKFISNYFKENDIIYNTNDLAYYTDKGEIIHLGRTDFQVKIRGFRVELGEIEKIIENNCHIKQTVVVKKTLNSGHDALIAYYTSSNEDVETINNELREELTEELPQYMVPQYFIKLDKLPQTPNGKIDRKMLPNLKVDETENNIVAPRNEIDRELVKIISKMLHIYNISINDTLLNLGGDSLTAITLSTKILSKFNVQINIKDILSNYRIRDISDYINLVPTKDMSKIKIEKAPIQEFYPLSSAQRRIYYNCKMIGEDNTVYNMPGGILVDEILDYDKVKKVVEKIIERHTILRTSFVLENDTVMQKIHDDIHIDIPVFYNKENEIKEIEEKFKRPFSLEKAPLIRVEIHYIDNKKTLVLMETHHIVMDGTSLNNFIIEFERLYNGDNLKRIPIQYKDYSVWENNVNKSEEAKRIENYWINKFKDSELSQLNLPYDYKMPANRSYNGNKITNIIDEHKFRRITRYAKKIGVSPYMLFISAFYILLYKYTGQEEITLGSPMANRNRNEMKRMIGMFVNNIVTKANIQPEKTFKEFLNEIKEQILDDLSYQPYPFDELVKKLGITMDNSRNPLFDVMFTYQNKEENIINLNDKETKIVEINDGISKFNLSFEVKPKTHVINIEYRTDLFKKRTIERMFEHYMNTIDCIMNDIDIKIKDIEVISEKEKNKILYEFNDTKVDYPQNKTMSELFEEQVIKTPNKIAVIFGDEKLTYKELNEKANSLAYFLRNVKNINREDTIGIMVKRSLEMIIAILGVMKAGGTYIPIDPSFPEDRVNYMLESSSACILLTSKKVENTINYKNKVIIDLDNSDIYSLPNTNIKNINNLSDLLYIIFTSGSTGKPKGVMQRQRTLVNFAHYCNDYVGYLKKPEHQTIVSISTVSFDIFSYEAIIPLQRGVTVVIANENEQTTPQLLNELMVKNNVTATQATPSVMQMFVNNVESIPSLKKLEYLTLTGEQVPITLVKKLKSFGNMVIYDGYGPTETYYCTLTEIKDDFVTIGKPFYNDQMYILDKSLKPVPIGVVGEIYIAGDGLAAGYLNNTELTEKSFIKNPYIQDTLMYKSGDLGKYLENGDIICLGRCDNQIKIRGLRIELGEIETLISKYPNIEKAIVVKQSIDNREFISAYFVANKRIPINDVRNYLAKSLPRYMIPSYYIPLDEFPYTPNGKVDRKKLSLPKNLTNIRNEEYVAPKTKLQKKLIKIFEDVLNTKPIGINDDFFELGGDSLLAMKLNIELLEITNKISYSDIFKFSTVCEIEEKINSDNGDFAHNKIEELPDSSLKVLEQILVESEVKEYHPRNILLTGATGYLGIHILEEFIKEEKGKVYCIIRKEPGLSTSRKLIQKLNYYFGDRYTDLINNRIIIVQGDICKTNFGLQDEELLEIINNVDVVINSAANVAHFGLYDNFYNTNVKSVNYIVEFCRKFNKKLYHISTTGVSGKKINPSYNSKEDKVEFYENSLYIGQYLDNVYTYTKFEAETIVLDAIAHNVDAYILRLGNLMPRLSDGIFQENVKENAFMTKIADFMKLGMIPDYLLDSVLEFTPVDIAAQAIYKIVTNISNQNRIFHVYNHNYITLESYFKIIKNFEYEMKVVNEIEFKEKVLDILQDEKKKINFENIASDLDNNYHLNYNSDIVLNSEFTIKYLQKCGFDWPVISREYLIRFIKLIRGEI